MEKSREHIIHFLKQFQKGKTQLPEIKVGETVDKNNLVKKFKFEFERAGGVFIKTTPEKIYDDLSKIIFSENARKIFAESFERGIDDIIKSLQADQIITQPHSEKHLSEVDVSITGCDFLVAETGTIVFIHNEKRFKSSLLLPRIHIVIAQENKICPTFEELFAQVGGNFDSILLITGPSRTADIEKVIVQGVHGPQKIYLLLI